MNFDAAVKHILQFEGGLVDNPKDPGGITNYGISLRAFPKLGEDGIRNLNEWNAALLYEMEYWDKAHCEDLPESIRLMMFDCAVNQGVNFSVRALQSALSLKADGLYGKRTKAAVCTLTSSDEGIVLRKLAHNRYYRYRRNKNWETFGDGWMARLLSVSLIT